MTPQELKETGQRLFKSHQYAEALPLLKSAADSFPKDETVWQELVLSASWSNQHDQAAEFAKNAIRQHPRSDWLWRQLGNELTAIDRLDEAEKALNNARDLNADAEWVWRYFVALQRKRKNLEGEIEALENLHVLKKAKASDLNQLGIAYHNRKPPNFAKALEFYRLSAITEPDAAYFFNMGLVFNDPEVSQDADAADAYRRALVLNPTYERPKERLEVTKQKLRPLAERARNESKGLIRSEEFFQFYINPFEVFPVEFEGDLSELDPKTIQRAKKRLFAEIDLNDGRIEWLENQVIDKSRALALENEILDEEKRRFHWMVFENPQLLRFLTRGEIEHFLYSDDYFPQKLLQHLDKEPEVRSFLSKPFARQYNLLLTRAIERRASSVIEVMFDGRRWVEREDEDICFEGASKRVNDLVAQMRDIAEAGKKQKVDLNEIQNLLSQKGVVEIFNLLPTTFRPVQSQFVSYIRSLAIDCHNEHSDTELSAKILGLCKQFRFKNADLNKQLEDDSKAVEKILGENRKHTFSMWIRQNQAAYINQQGIKYEGAEVKASDVESIRWGIYVRTVNGLESEHSFALVVRGSQTHVAVEWGKRGVISGVKSLFRKKTEVIPVVEMSSADQEVYFRKMIDAVIHYLIQPLVSKLAQRLRSGNLFEIGPCTLTTTGIAFRIGLIFRKDILVPWHDAETQMHNGQVVVFSKSNRKMTIAMPAKDTDNAVIFPILCAAMREEIN